MKYYQNNKNDEVCYPLSYWQRDAFNEQKPIIVEEMKYDTSESMKWCQEEQEFMNKGDDVCGKSCDSYSPRNGKSGYCRNARHTLIGTGKFIKVMPDGKVERE